MSANKDRIICNMYVGEHVEDAAKGLCEWLTNCLFNKMKPLYFSKIWKSYLEDGENIEVPGKTGDSHWIDSLEFVEDDLDSIYEQAYKANSEKFIIFNNNAFIDIVAIAGHPPGKEIASHVLGMKIDDWVDADTQYYLGDDYLSKEKNNEQNSNNSGSFGK